MLWVGIFKFLFDYFSGSRYIVSREHFCLFLSTIQKTLGFYVNVYKSESKWDFSGQSPIPSPESLLNKSALKIFT